MEIWGAFGKSSEGGYLRFKRVLDITFEIIRQAKNAKVYLNQLIKPVNNRPFIVVMETVTGYEVLATKIKDKNLSYFRPKTGKTIYIKLNQTVRDNIDRYNTIEKDWLSEATHFEVYTIEHVASEHIKLDKSRRMTDLLRTIKSIS